MMRVGDEIIGALSLDFLITNPLREDTLELLDHFACWLGDLYLEKEENKDLKERVTRLDHEAAFANIASQVIHKYRNVVVGAYDLLTQLSDSVNAADPAAIRSVIAKLCDRIEELRALPTELTAVARKPEVTDVQLREVCEEVAAELTDKATRCHVQIQVNCEEEHWVRADRSALRVCVFNVLDNGIDASEGNGPSDIEVTSSTDIDQEIVVLRVRDYGVGLVAGDQDVATPEAFFVPGFTTKTTGIGWGLYFSRKLLRQMGGDLFLEPRRKGVEAIIQLATVERNRRIDNE